MGNPSASKYFYPLPVARSVYYVDDEDAAIFKSTGFKDLKKLMLSYDGPYAVSTSWFGENYFQDVYAHLDQEVASR